MYHHGQQFTFECLVFYYFACDYVQLHQLVGRLVHAPRCVTDGCCLTLGPCTIPPMPYAPQVNGIKEMTRLLSAQSQFDNRRLLSLDHDQRNVELQREMLSRSNTHNRMLDNRSSSFTPSFSSSFGGPPKPTPPTRPPGQPSGKPVSRGSRKPEMDL